MEKSICFQCDKEEELLKDKTTCIYCDSLNRKNDYLNKKFDITKENIHLYYEFMSDEDLENHQEILSEIFEDRYSQVFSSVNLHATYFKIKIINKYYNVGQSFFEKKDMLIPIDEYIKEIKESEAYIKYIAEKE